MLLQLTTHRSEIMFQAHNGYVTEVDLPKGTYTFELIDNPINLDGDAWIMLEQTHLSKLDLDSDAIVGMAYTHVAIHNNMALSMSFYDPRGVMNVRIIAPSVVEEIPALAEAPQASKARPPIVSTPPCIIYPRFIRYDRAGRHTTSTMVNHDRRRKLHPAARRAC